MDGYILHNARLVQPGYAIVSGYLYVVNGIISEVGPGNPSKELTGTRIDCHNQRLTPGLIDIHTHGIHAFNYDRGSEHLHRAAEQLGQYGTTSVVPTIVPTINKEFFTMLNDFCREIPNVTQVSIPGIHLEGPFVAITGAACETRDGDVALLDEMLDACGDYVAVMSIAPDVPNIIPVIERLVERGVTPFITHTRASVEQTLAAMDAGACHATHFYDVFPAPEETDPGVRPVGVVETILGDPRGTCDFIADGVHVHPMAIRAAVAAKGVQGVSLITDASFGAGLGAGVYETPWGYPVEVKPGNAPRIADPNHPMYGGLAGSALTMDQGINNLFRWLDYGEEHIWAMATRNPATVIGAHRKGTLDSHTDADLVLWAEENGQFVPVRTWVNGETVYTENDV